MAACFFVVLICLLPATAHAADDDTTGRVAIGDTSTTLQQSRSLLQGLRRGPRAPARVISTRPQTSPAGSAITTPAKRQLAPSANAKANRPGPPPVPSIPLRTQAPPPVPPVPRIGPETNAASRRQSEFRSVAADRISPRIASRQAPARPPVPPVPELKSVPPSPAAAQKLKHVPSPQPVTDRLQMQINNILLASGQDDETGAVQPPVDLPPVDMTNVAPPPAERHDSVDLSGKVHIGSLTDNGVVVNRPRRPDKTTRVQKIYGFDGTVVKNNFRRGTTKVRHRTGKLLRPFVEFYDPDYDVDNYNMPVLLVAAEEKTDESDNEEEGTGLLSRKLSDIKPTLEYAWGDLDDTQLPDDFHKRMDNGPYVEKPAPRTVVQWAPTNLWYYPLYFEDPGLERYGHTRKPWIQPFVSTGRFFGQVVGLPYQATLHPPHCREYALGYYQPGEWAPKKKYQVPWNEEAAATEFLWITGLILLIP